MDQEGRAASEMTASLHADGASNAVVSRRTGQTFHVAGYTQFIRVLTMLIQRRFLYRSLAS